MVASTVSTKAGGAERASRTGTIRRHILRDILRDIRSSFFMGAADPSCGAENPRIDTGRSFQLHR
jgi:hypothetical protein